MKYRKYVLLLCVLTSFISCSLEDRDLERRISNDISLNKELILSGYDDFEWDSLIILHPYSKIGETEKKHQLRLSRVSRSIESREHINLIIFLKESKGVKTCELNRIFGDFKGFYDQIIPKEKANFILEGEIGIKNPPKLKLK